MIKKFLSEEIIVPVIISVALLISLSPFVYELTQVKQLSPLRYPLFESDFAPDMRFYLSRMQEGYDGNWLVYEKYTSEPHQPSILHISYLFMGKITGLVGIPPAPAFPIWKLLCGIFFLATGYYCLLVLLPQAKPRLLAFLLFVFAGNFPIPAKSGIPFLGLHFSSFLSWYTFFDPVKRLIFIPHYTLSAGFFFLGIAFLLQAFKSSRWLDFFKSSVLFFLAGLVLPTTLLVAIAIVLLFTASKLAEELKKGQLLAWIKHFLLSSWMLWLLLFAGIAVMKLSLSYFPWNIQSLADLEKRSFSFTDFLQIFFGLGPTGILGFLGSFYILLKGKKDYFLPVFWFLGTFLLILLFIIFPFSNPTRPIQVDLHLPLAIASVVVIFDFLALLKNTRRFVFGLILFLLFFPTFLVWSVSLKAQAMFVDAKITAGYPLIPQLPYVVYPVRTVMEAIFWLRDYTPHQAVVLSGETIGSMIPAYAGNAVYLGHGNQTVYFPEKMALMKRFYQGDMTTSEEVNFLKNSRINYVFYGPEEAALGKINPQDPFLRLIYNNSNVSIYKVL